MVKTLILIAFLFSMQMVMADSRYVTTYTPGYPEQYCSFAGQDRGISRLENKYFNRTYKYDTPEERISRLEEQMFGARQTGDLKKRLSMLQKANSHMNYGNDAYAPSYYAPPIVAGSGWKSMLHSFGDYMMGGVPTGITPQMDPAYMDYFEAERNAMKFNDGGNSGYVRTNHGWSGFNTKRGTTTGVTLID